MKILDESPEIDLRAERNVIRYQTSAHPMNICGVTADCVVYGATSITLGMGVMATVCVPLNSAKSSSSSIDRISLRIDVRVHIHTPFIALQVPASRLCRTLLS
jgi:hypothetical protein